MSEQRPRDTSELTNAALGDLVESMSEELLARVAELNEARSRLAESTSEGWSPDNLVRVECGPAGVPRRVELAPEAFRRSSKESLERAIVAAAQAAARAAQAERERLLAPLTEAVGGMVDLPDLVPGAPSLKDIVQPQHSAPVAAPAPISDEDEDDYFRNQRYLRGN